MKGRLPLRQLRNNAVRKDFAAAIDSGKSYETTINELIEKYFISKSTINQIIKELGIYGNNPKNKPVHRAANKKLA